MHHVYLIPGFLGFRHLGGLDYFSAVRPALARGFRAQDKDVRIITTDTVPMGSLKRRTQGLLDDLRRHGSLDRADAIHFVGHSTGGLDARILTAAASELGGPDLRLQLSRKLRTVVTLSTPHYGTPLANCVATTDGKELFHLSALLVLLGMHGRIVGTVAGAIDLVCRLNDRMGRRNPILEESWRLLANLTPGRERRLRDFLRSIFSDASLLVQLSPDSMDILRLFLQPLPQVRYVSYATVAPPPWEGLKQARLDDLLYPFPVLLYNILYRLSACHEDRFTYHPEVPARDALTGERLPISLTPSSNDGIVPTLSQIYGEFRGCVQGDHLDVIGHYERLPSGRADSTDYFFSGSGFDQSRFHALWSDVSQVLLRSADNVPGLVSIPDHVQPQAREAIR